MPRNPKRNTNRRNTHGEVFTPLSIVNEMLDLVPQDCWHKTFIEPSCGDGNFIVEIIRRKLQHGQSLDDALDTTYGIELQTDNIEKCHQRILLEFGAVRKDRIMVGDAFAIEGTYDICVANPPYTANINLKMMDRWLSQSLARQYIIVHPANWLIDLKGTYKPFNRAKQQMAKRLSYIKCFNGNPIFDIQLFVPCCIMVAFQEEADREISVNYFGEVWKESNLYDITKYGKAWKPLVKPFFQQMQQVCSVDNVWKHNVGKKYVNRNVSNNKGNASEK